MPVAIIQFPGSNCDHDAFHALRHKERYLSKSGIAFMALVKTK